jgi:hypothetical protein
MILKVKNWNKFQHYKDRNPPWIKLHKEQLDNPDYMSLSFACMGLAQLLWLLASESKTGDIEASEKNLTFRLRKPWPEIKKLLTTLINDGFFIVLADDSAAIAGDTKKCSEREAEREREADIFDCAGEFEKLWSEYPRKEGKKEAFRHFKSTVKDADGVQSILIALANYKELVKGSERRYIKNGATWFNNWQDYENYDSLMGNAPSQEEYNFVE